MQVRAIGVGYYGGEIRKQGEVFEVATGSKASWFEPVKGKVEPPAAPTQAELEAAKRAEAEAALAASVPPKVPGMDGEAEADAGKAKKGAD